MAEAIPRLGVRDGLGEIVSALRGSGAVIVEDMLDADTLRRFNGEIDAPLAAAEPGRRLVNPVIEGFFGPHTRHITGVAGRSRTFAEAVLCHPLLLGVCDELLLPSCASYRLNIAHVLDRGPGAEQQLLHRDELVWVHLFQRGFWDGPDRPELQVASILALEDFDAENGATRIIPGSHRWPRDREPAPGDTVAAEMPAGAAVVYLGSTIHGGGPNTTRDRRRRGMHQSYTLGWLRTEENHYLTTPLEVAKTLPRRAQELLGYATHDAIASGGGYLGAVDTASPLDLIDQGRL